MTMTTYYEIIHRTDEAETLSRTTFRFDKVTDAAQFCSSAGGGFFVIAVEDGHERALNAEEHQQADGLLKTR